MNRRIATLAAAWIFIIPWSMPAAAGQVAPENPRIAEAQKALAADDVTGAKIALNSLLAETKDPLLLRRARRMLDIDVGIANAGEQLRRRQLFLVESTLRAAERKLGTDATDQALRKRIADLRGRASDLRRELRRDDAHMALAVRHLLETEKLFRGDYPLLQEDADKVIAPALRKAGDEFTMIDWKPTLRGYRLVLQDKRTGESFVVTPD